MCWSTSAVRLGSCYSKVAALTQAMKAKLMQYNPYALDGERADVQNQRVVFLLKDESIEGMNDEEVKRTKVIQLDQDTPEWFNR